MGWGAVCVSESEGRGLTLRGCVSYRLLGGGVEVKCEGTVIRRDKILVSPDLTPAVSL